ncbi:hypothetical protein E2P81_ATG07605 [Venturia nashicola]|nr:hypothetical protein E2P81_ATG07605 [Venturia nashicola]
MQFKTQALVAILATTVAAHGAPSAVTGAAASKVNSYLAHVTAEAQYASFSSVASTAVKSKWLDSFLKGDLHKIATKSWYSGLPADIKSFAESMQKDISKIATATGSGRFATATSTTATSARATRTVSLMTSKSASSASQTAVHAASSSASSVSKSTSSAASRASSGAAATATKNDAMKTGVGRMMGVVAAGALGALML